MSMALSEMIHETWPLMLIKVCVSSTIVDEIKRIIKNSEIIK